MLKIYAFPQQKPVYLTELLNQRLELLVTLGHPAHKLDHILWYMLALGHSVDLARQVVASYFSPFVETQPIRKSRLSSICLTSRSRLRISTRVLAIVPSFAEG